MAFGRFLLALKININKHKKYVKLYVNQSKSF